REHKRQSRCLLQLPQAARQAGLRLPLRQAEGRLEIAARRPPARDRHTPLPGRKPSFARGKCRIARVYRCGPSDQKPLRALQSTAKSSLALAEIDRWILARGGPDGGYHHALSQDA